MLPVIMNSIEIFQIVVVTITVPCYIFLLIFMVKAQLRRVDELATPFFKLCISSSVIDLTTLFTNYFGAMFPKFGFFSDFYLQLGGIYGHIYFYIAWSTGICQAMSVSVLATNRLSAMIFPENYQKMWLGYRLRIAIALQFLPGLCIGMLTFFNTTVLVVNENGGVVPKFVKRPEDYCGRSEHYCRGREDYCRRTEDYCRGSEEYCRGPEDYCRGPEDYCRGPEDYCRGPEDYCRGPEDYCRGPEDYCRGPEDYCRRSEDYCRRPEDYCRRTKDYCRGPEDYCRGLEDYCRGPHDYCREPKDYCRRSKDYCR
ncbi:hypothetical protein CRE_21721 [Caenorhabditis remanei]|uniref:G protein-coupled receptor n=1 Tax=Caenorhabditis remanei TaxID=31234 RepID=E3MEG9_CAERE|nr:hypothetical protein CRE_21721 [Caenorhabditis remanei]